jgi:hypothetical protein
VSLDFRQDRPLWLRALNAGGRALDAAGLRLARLDLDDLLRTAQARTGLSDFFGDEFREPLARLVDSLQREARLTPVGRVLARQDILVALENRLKMADWFGRYPEIGAQPLRRPLFITGLPRSGTSILHELLAQDPAHRVPLSWEVRYCCPPPDEAAHRDDPRIRKAQRDLTLWHALVPAYKTMHEMGGRIPCECGDITMNTFLGDRFMALHQVPGYAAWANAQDMRPVYAFHRRMLQLLQWRMPRERWVLKAPAHMNWLPALLAVYPDACIVQTHRDPLQVMGSVASLLSAILWMRSDDVDPAIIAASFGGEAFAAQLEGAMRFRDSPAADARRFFDVRYHDLMSDPWGTISGVYRHFDLELTPQARSRMERYLAQKPKGKFGRHEYSFAELGLDLASERARFARYQERYAVKSEVV